MGVAPAARPQPQGGRTSGVPAACQPAPAPQVAPPGAVSALHATSQVDVVVGGVDHRVIAGSLPADHRQGAVVVLTASRPGCAPGREASSTLLLDTAGQSHPSPRGELTLLRATGSVVVFRTASGDVGTFDVATGTFGPQG